MRLRKFFSISTGSRFRENFLKVARANLIALAMPLLVTPILTRLFTPNDYGTLAIFTSVLALLTSFCTWRFDWVLPNARTMTMAASVFVIGTIVLFAICFAVALAIPVIRLSTLGDTSLGSLGNLLFFLPIALVGAGLRQMFAGWFVRRGDLTAVSHATIAQSAATVLMSLGTGVLKLGAFGLIIATVIATWAGMSTLIRQARSELISAARLVNSRSLRAAISKHSGNANWSTVVSLVNALSLNAPILVLGYFYPPHEVGWYALMYRLVATPVGVLTSALGQSFWSQAAEHARARQFSELNRLYRKTTFRLGLVCVPVAAGCLAGPFFVGPLLGTVEWGGAGYVLAAMTPLFIGSILFSPTNHLVVLDKQHLQLLVDSLRLVLVTASIAIAAHMGFGLLAAVMLTSFSSFFGHALLFFIHLREHKSHE